MEAFEAESIRQREDIRIAREKEVEAIERDKDNAAEKDMLDVVEASGADEILQCGPAVNGC